MLYFIQSGRSDFVKIGHCVGEPRKRLGQLQVGNPEKLQLISVKAGGEAEERVFHQRFAHLRVRGEWFRWDDELREAARPYLKDPDLERQQRIAGIRALIAMPPDEVQRRYEEVLAGGRGPRLTPERLSA